jgi:hypothetical protein
MCRKNRPRHRWVEEAKSTVKVKERQIRQVSLQLRGALSITTFDTIEEQAGRECGCQSGVSSERRERERDGERESAE